MDVLDLVWEQLNKELDKVRDQVTGLSTRTERAETAGGVLADTFANRPLAATGAAAGDLLWISDGRKSGEGAGAGTGVFAYYNPSTDAWKRVSDDVDVAI